MRSGLDGKWKKLHCESDEYGLKLPDKRDKGNILSRPERISCVFVVDDIVTYPCPLYKQASFLRIPGGNPSARFLPVQKRDVSRIARTAPSPSAAPAV